MRAVALLTDFGIQDIYVGVMKGVIQTIRPGGTMIDITHAIDPQSVRLGALALRDSVPYFPPATVFLVVVDPGVGSDRRAIAVQTEDYFFVAPDNGVLTYVLPGDEPFQAVVLDNPAYHLSDSSYTFHGRDIFAPAAAYLAAGLSLSQLGTPIEPDTLIRIPAPELEVQAGSIRGEVTHIDRFGNIITSIGRWRWKDQQQLQLEPDEAGATQVSLDVSQCRVTVGETTLTGIQRAYYQVSPGELLVHISSNRFLEVSINQGNAAEQLDAQVGQSVVVTW